jgi:hypothetical protein
MQDPTWKIAKAQRVEDVAQMEEEEEEEEEKEEEQY